MVMDATCSLSAKDLFDGILTSNSFLRLNKSSIKANQCLRYLRPPTLRAGVSSVCKASPDTNHVQFQKQDDLHSFLEVPHAYIPLLRFARYLYYALNCSLLFDTLMYLCLRFLFQ